MNATTEILYSHYDDIFFIKLYGALRFNQSAALENCFLRLQQEKELKQVCIDLTSVSTIDSTMLGLLAQIGIFSQEKLQKKAVLMAHHPDLLSLLLTVAFERVFVILSDTQSHDVQFEPVEVMPEPDHTMAERVLAAHRTLMQLSTQNYREFKHVVSLLEQDFIRKFEPRT